MVELRFNAIKPNGQAIGGTLNAPSYKEAKQKINQLAQKHKLNITIIISSENERTFRFFHSRNRMSI